MWINTIYLENSYSNKYYMETALVRANVVNKYPLPKCKS